MVSPAPQLFPKPRSRDSVHGTRRQAPGRGVAEGQATGLVPAAAAAGRLRLVLGGLGGWAGLLPAVTVAAAVEGGLPWRAAWMPSVRPFPPSVLPRGISALPEGAVGGGGARWVGKGCHGLVYMELIGGWIVLQLALCPVQSQAVFSTYWTAQALIARKSLTSASVLLLSIQVRICMVCSLQASYIA